MVKKLFILAATLFSAYISASPAPNQIRGLYQAFETEKACFSPVHGFAYVVSGQLERLYRLGDPDSSAVKLAHWLFYRRDDRELLQPSKIRPQRFLDAQVIGLLVKTIAQCPPGMDLANEIKTALSNHFKLHPVDPHAKKPSCWRMLAQNVKASINAECDKKIAPYTTYTLLLSLLWEISQSIEDLYPYMQELSESGLLRADWESFIKEMPPYTADDTTRIKRNLGAVGETCAQEHLTAIVTNNSPVLTYEELLWHLFDRNRTVQTKLTEPTTCTGTPYMSVAGKSYCFMNCCEAAMLTVLNNLIFDPTQQQLDFSILESAFPGLHPRIRAFYNSQYATLGRIHLKDSSQEWARQLSNLNSDETSDQFRIAYVINGECEVEVGLRNSVNLLSNITGKRLTSWKMFVDDINQQRDARNLGAVSVEIKNKSKSSTIKNDYLCDIVFDAAGQGSFSFHHTHDSGELPHAFTANNETPYMDSTLDEGVGTVIHHIERAIIESLGQIREPSHRQASMQLLVMNQARSDAQQADLLHQTVKIAPPCQPDLLLVLYANSDTPTFISNTLTCQFECNTAWPILINLARHGKFYARSWREYDRPIMQLLRFAQQDDFIREITQTTITRIISRDTGSVGNIIKTLPSVNLQSAEILLASISELFGPRTPIADTLTAMQSVINALPDEEELIFELLADSDDDTEGHADTNRDDDYECPWATHAENIAKAFLRYTNERCNPEATTSLTCGDARKICFLLDAIAKQKKAFSIDTQACAEQLNTRMLALLKGEPHSPYRHAETPLFMATTPVCPGVASPAPIHPMVTPPPRMDAISLF